MQVEKLMKGKERVDKNICNEIVCTTTELGVLVGELFTAIFLIRLYN